MRLLKSTCIHKGRINSTLMIIMFAIFLILTSCSDPLNEDTIVGTWVVEEVTTQAWDKEPESIWVNKNNFSVVNFFRKDDQWTFTENQILKHESEIGIWPTPRTFKLENDQLYFYVNFLGQETSKDQPLTQYTIVEGDANQFSIKQSNSKSSSKTIAILKKIQ